VRGPLGLQPGALGLLAGRHLGLQPGTLGLVQRPLRPHPRLAGLHRPQPAADPEHQERPHEDRIDPGGAARVREFAALAPALLEASDIAALALFLASDESRHINGAVIPVDGRWAAV
jgi:NAD(P)-dependent dehydrogenase (short-subunit alcohol dehydrogenase family)